MYREITKQIQIDVEPSYIPEKSQPQKQLFFFGYRVKITNLRTSPTQLLSRHWVITDGHGHVEHVEGPGVVGETPRILPGESFEYNSFCPLPTPTGNMRGTFQMVADDGEKYDVRIPLFFLREPQSLH